MALKYRPEIDGLRTIAVLSVIIYHAEFTFKSDRLLKGGFFGVDIFFVISGFLITSLVLSEHLSAGRFSIMNFYERRARRLLPALLTVMLVSLPFAWEYLRPTQLIDFSQSLIASLLFGSNFYWHTTLQEYGAESALLKPFLHTWSLAVEEQYYIIYPLILAGIYRWYKKYTVVILTAGFLLSLLFAEWATAGHTSFSFYMLPSRFWELIAGGLLANILLFHPQKDNDSLLNRTMPVFGLFLILYSVFFTEFESNHPGFVTLLPVAGTVLIIWFANEKDLVTKVLSNKLLVRIGLISYSLYLWHYPVFAFGRLKDFNSSDYDKLLWILLTFALSIATYFLIETPFRRRHIISLKTMFVLLLASLAIVGTYSLYSIQNDGVKKRFPKLIEIYEKNEFDNKKLQSNSWTILFELAKSQGMKVSHANKPSDFEAKELWFSNSATTKKVLIVGDSYSKDLFNALYQNMEYFPGLEFARFGMKATILSEETEQINLLLESPNFMISDIVIISFRYKKEAAIKGIPSLIQTIGDKSKKVMLVLDTVGFDDINGQPVFDGYIETYSGDISVNKMKKLFFKSRDHKNDKFNKPLSNIAKNNNVVLLDRADFICDMESKACDGITNDGYKAFYDRGHFTLEGAKYFGRRMHEINWLRID